jgi:hypothetical protein
VGPKIRLSVSGKLLFLSLLPLVLSGFLSAPLHAKEVPVTAIALYDTPGGPAYLQITGLLINGKSEMRVCEGASKIDKRVYDSLERTQLSSASALERNADGVLLLTLNGKAVCVLPGNLRFERNAELTPAQAAEQAVLQGLPVSSSQPGAALPEFRPGVRLVLVAAPDVELAEYLRAQRAGTAKDWQDFLLRYPSSAHAAEIKNELAAIQQRAAEASFAAFQKSQSERKADIALLKQAQQQAQLANHTASGYRPAVKLMEGIGKEMEALAEPDRTRLEIYRKALAENTAGHSQLPLARHHCEQVLDVRPDYAPVLNLCNDIVSEERKLEVAVETAESLGNSRRFDDAVNSLGNYRSLAQEVPRIRAVEDAAYGFHFNRGQELLSQQKSDAALSEFHKALAIRADSAEATAALKAIESQQAEARDRSNVDRALADSKDLAAKGQFIEAYNALADLPESQRPLVSDQLAALSKDYVAAAFRRAQKLQELHLPIRGRADEDAMRQAYELLDRASAASGDPATRLKLDLLSDKISAYYVDQAKRYLEKPLGSGVGVGWLYLGEAQRFKPNLDVVKDAMAQYAPAYQLRSRLSVGVVIRDQTSRRDSLGFADQLTDAIASGLESSGLAIKVVRQPREATDAVQPNFLLIGEIMEHRSVKNANLESLQSKYRAGTHEVKSEDWLQASHQYDAAQQQLTDAQRALSDAMAQHKKKEVVAAAADAVQNAQKRADDARHKLETTDQTRVQPVIEPYNYTRKNVDLNAVVEVGYRISDQAGNVLQPPAPIKKDNHTTAIVLENVKPEDTEGVKPENTEPDEVRFLTDLEIQARDALVKSVREEASALPLKVLQEARSRVQRGDVDGAAEEYIVYLNAAPDTTSQEREEAEKFLREQFNVEMKPLAASR